MEILKLNDNTVSKFKKLITSLSSDVLELVTRTTVGLETIYENAMGESEQESKYSKSPQNLRESYMMLLENKKDNSIRKTIRLGLIGLQSSINPKQGYRNKMRYEKE
jgi:hypothetical protein